MSRANGSLRISSRRDLLVRSVAPYWIIHFTSSGSSRLGGTRLSGPPIDVGLPISLPRARQACPSSSRRDLLVGSAWRDALVASAAQCLIIHHVSTGTTGVPLRFPSRRDALVASAAISFPPKNLTHTGERPGLKQGGNTKRGRGPHLLLILSGPYRRVHSMGRSSKGIAGRNPQCL